MRPRWGHSAALVGGYHGYGSLLLVVGGADADGNALQDAWVLDLLGPTWQALPHLAVPAPMPVLQSVAWIGPWISCLHCSGARWGMWQESDFELQRRLQRQRAHHDRRLAGEAAEAAEERRQRQRARRFAEAEEREARRQRKQEEEAKRLAEEAATKAREKEELERWVQQKRQIALQEERARKAEEERMQQERRLKQECAVGGGFDLKKLARLQGSEQTNPQGCEARGPIRPNFAGWGKLGDATTRSPPLRAGATAALQRKNSQP